MGFKLAELYIDIKPEMDPFTKGISMARNQVSAFAVSIGTVVGNAVTSALAMASHTVKDFFASTIGQAKELQQVERVLGLAFGESTDKVKSFAKEMSEAWGLSRVDMERAAIQFGEIALKAGWSRDGAAEYAKSLITAAAELHSVNTEGETFAAVLESLYMGTEGATRGLKRVGITITETMVEQEAMRLGMVRFGKEFTEQQLQIARSIVIMKDLKLAQGDLESRLGSTSLMAQQMTGKWREVGNEIGQRLLPLYNDWIKWQYDLTNSIIETLHSGETSFESFGSTIASVFNMIPSFFDNLNTMLTISTLKIQEWATNFADAVASILTWTKMEPISNDDAIKQVATDFVNREFEREKEKTERLFEKLKPPMSTNPTARGNLAANQIMPFNPESMGSADFGRKLTMSIMGSSTNIAQRQLNEQEKIAKAAEATAENTRRNKGAVMQ